jgi:hypothetical protein
MGGHTSMLMMQDHVHEPEADEIRSNPVTV